MGKLIKKSEIKDILDNLKAQNKTVVFTNGCFDILHAGHVKYLQKSAEFGDILMVGLNSDSSVKKLKGESRPINNEIDRATVLCALEAVDYVIIFDENSPTGLLEEIKPDIYTKGADYTISTLPEAPTVLKNGGHVEFIDFVEGKSTTNIVNAIKK